MDTWSPTGAAFSRLGFDPTGVRSSSYGAGGDPTGVRSVDWNTRSGDPTGVGDVPYGGLGRLGQPQGFDPLLDFGLNAMAEQIAKRKAEEAQFTFFQPTIGGSTGAGGMASIGGDWAGVDRWSTAIQAAANKYGVPANLIKAVMKLESNGDPNSTGAPGVWGPMQVNSSAWGYGPWSTDPLANIDKGVAILKDGYNGNWDDALIAYRGGWGSDGYTTGQTYLDAVHANLAQLDAMPMSPVGFDPTGGTESHGSTTAGLSSMFDSQNISYEFGVNSDLGYYDYGTSYGLNGVQHTGIDVSMPYGTAYRAPMGGTVTCSGTGTGQGGTGDGCGAFNSYDDSGNINGAGRVEITLDNGVVLIYGHSSRAAVQIGQRVNAGDIVGYSGSMNGPHVHLEARIRDASMPSGWRIVDPRTVLGGASFGGAAPNGFSQVTTPAQTTGTDWGSMMMNFLLQPGFHW